MPLFNIKYATTSINPLEQAADKGATPCLFYCNKGQEYSIFRVSYSHIEKHPPYYS